MIHWDNQIVAATDRKLGLGVEPIGEGAIKIIDEPDGPKGIMNMYNTRAYKFIMENKAVNMRARGKNSYYARTSMVLPGILLVEHWPVPGWAQYEWYVPDRRQASRVLGNPGRPLPQRGGAGAKPTI